MAIFLSASYKYGLLTQQLAKRKALVKGFAHVGIMYKKLNFDEEVSASSLTGVSWMGTFVSPGTICAPPLFGLRAVFFSFLGNCQIDHISCKQG